MTIKYHQSSIYIVDHNHISLSQRSSIIYHRYIIIDQNHYSLHIIYHHPSRWQHLPLPMGASQSQFAKMLCTTSPGEQRCGSNGSKPCGLSCEYVRIADDGDVLPKTIWYLYMTLAYCYTYHGVYIYNIIHISIVMYSIGFAHPHVAIVAQSHNISSGKASKPQICIKYPNQSQICIYIYPTSHHHIMTSIYPHVYTHHIIYTTSSWW